MLTYSLVSSVIAGDRTTLRQGIRRLAEVAHKYSIPITWGVGPAAARSFAADLTEWHTTHGDEVTLLIDIAPIWGSGTDSDNLSQSAEHIVTMREKLPDFISAEKDRLQRAIEWANPIIAGGTQKNHVLLYALAQVGFTGLWGYDWKNTADEGCPFGWFFPSAEQHNFCGTSTSRIIGIPYTSLLPIQALRKQAEETDFQAQILNGAAQQAFDCYAANAEWNRSLVYVQHINAAEVAALTPEQIGRLDAYLADVRDASDTQIMSLPDVVRACQEIGEQTQPTFLLTDTREESEEEASTDSGQSILAYYDAECQLFFEEGQIEPIQVTNYISPPINSRSGVEVNLPQIEQFRPSRSRNQLRMQFTVESTKAMPYGLAVWGNHAGLTLASSDVRNVTWVSDRLLFIRSNLQVGKNEIEVILTI